MKKTSRMLKTVADLRNLQGQLAEEYARVTTAIHTLIDNPTKAKKYSPPKGKPKEGKDWRSKRRVRHVRYKATCSKCTQTFTCYRDPASLSHIFCHNPCTNLIQPEIG